MRFDDRLRTVLAQAAGSPHDLAVRWRQLVELAARAPSDGDRQLLADALSEIRAGIGEVDERVRAAASLAIASLPVPADLVAAFAADRLHIAAPILAGARLTPAEWKAVAAAASDDCHAFLETMRSSDEPSPVPPTATPADGAAGSHIIPSISDVVARIERLRQAREGSAFNPTPSLTADEPTALFRWECGESGDIEWVEGIPRGALVGQSIAHGGSGTGVDQSVERAFASRAPFHDGVLELAAGSATAGTWKISGIPSFDRSTGRFAGYRGLAERPSPTANGDGAAVPADPNSIRELAHEIRTPLNAIIGFAEIITGEYLGPADSAYRQRAGEIVRQARLLLSAVEDLDFAARIHSANGAENARCDLGELVERVIAEIREIAGGAGVEIEPTRSAHLVAAVQPELAERLILRMCSAAVARAAEGETLRLGVECEGEQCVVSISRPAMLRDESEELLFGNADDALSPAFPLRLARGLAQSAGASLVASPGSISLLFPAA